MPGLTNYKFGKQYTKIDQQLVENEGWAWLSNNFLYLEI